MKQRATSEHLVNAKIWTSTLGETIPSEIQSNLMPCYSLPFSFPNAFNYFRPYQAAGLKISFSPSGLFMKYGSFLDYSILSDEQNCPISVFVFKFVILFVHGLNLCHSFETCQRVCSKRLILD